MQPRPFTVVGGFLGAGKTTLVNHILAGAAGTRYAVLVNDFGAVNIDERLIDRHDGRTMALTNGCICCSMADGFIQTMLTLMADPGAFDHVIVEASGVAEPDRIMDFARLDPALSPDAIVTLVDAESFLPRLADPRISDVVRSQVRSADLLVLNKADLVSEADRVAVRDQLTVLNGAAPVLQSHAAEVPLEVLLGARSQTLKQKPQADAKDLPFSSALVRAAHPISRDAFDHWQSALGADVLRGKGRVWLDDGHHLWQRVGQRATLETATSTPEGTEIVLIALTHVQPPWPPPTR